MPEVCGGGAVSLEYQAIVTVDFDGAGGEDNITPGVAKLANGEERMGGKVWDDVGLTGSEWELGNI